MVCVGTVAPTVVYNLFSDQITLAEFPKSLSRPAVYMTKKSNHFLIQYFYESSVVGTAED